MRVSSLSRQGACGMMSRRSLPLLLLWCYVHLVSAEEAGYADDAKDDANKLDDYYYNANYDANGQYDGNAGYLGSGYSSSAYQEGSDYIKYWTDFAILPKRCIVYNNVDVVVFTVHAHGYQKQCSDDPIGTYIAPVPYFMNGYLQEIAMEMSDQGYDYQVPGVAQFIGCTPYQFNGNQFYFQLGCADSTSQALAVNIYKDNTCTTRSLVDGYDDSNIDVSAIQLPFKKCKACVNWYDLAGEADDGYYENHQKNAPLCSTAWSVKQTCDKKCQHTGLESVGSTGWNTSDKILLAILSLFGCIMLGLIVRKRQKMSNKDALLEQAAMSAAGLQQPHVIGIFVLVVIVVLVFALLGLKNITWALLLLINTALFGYLMKLTVDSGVSAGESVIGPDGTILRRDSDDSSVESASKQSSQRNAGTYVLPTIA